MTGASPVTTIHGNARLRHAVARRMVVTGLAPVMFQIARIASVYILIRWQRQEFDELIVEDDLVDELCR
jgi:hypothetical protein